MSAHALDLSSAETALGVKLIANGIGTQALHDTVVGYQANRRSGSAATLTKAMVSASGSKPYRQKGTGNARAGYIASPVRRGGGVVFGPQPRDYSKKLPKKVRKLALKKAISEAAKSGRLFSAPRLEMKSPKTRDMAAWLNNNNLSGSILFITKEFDKPFFLSGRNIPRLEMKSIHEVNAEHVLRPKHIVIFDDALPALAERIK